MQFPGARGPETENKCYHAIRDGYPHVVYTLHFGRPDPHGRGNIKYGGFRPLWPRVALGNCRAQAENGGGTQFPGARATVEGEIRTAQKFLPESALFFLLFTGGKS